MSESSSEEVWTLGAWRAKAGQEEAFKAEWINFAGWSCKNQPGAKDAYLLQDPANPQVFFSFGPWQTADAVSEWRQTPEFGAFFAKARALCDDIQPNTLRLVTHITGRAGS